MGDGSKPSKTPKIDSKKHELQLHVLRNSYYSQGGNAVFPRWEHAEILRKTFRNLGTFRQKSPRKVAEVAVISEGKCRDFLQKLP